MKAERMLCKEVLRVRHTMPNHDASNLILGHDAMQNQRKSHQDPGQIRGGEDQEAQETQPRVGVAPAPDVDEGAAEGGAEEGDGEQGGEEEEDTAGVEE